jgi:hypothetical protein
MYNVLSLQRWNNQTAHKHRPDNASDGQRPIRLEEDALEGYHVWRGW